MRAGKQGERLQGNSVRNDDKTKLDREFKTKRGKGRTQNTTNLNVYYANSRSMRNKMDDIRALVCTEEIDIIAFTETWINLDTRELPVEYQIAGYKLFHTDRQTRKGGGVAIYVRDNLKCEINKEIKTERNTETIWIELSDGREKLITGVIYRPPNLDSVNERLIWDEMRRASIHNKVCIVGDFNLGQIDWTDLTGNSESEDFLETIQDCFLSQHITEPTRGNNILDLVLSNRENLISNVEVGNELANSDHKEIRFQLDFQGRRKENSTKVPDFRRANFDSLKRQLREGVSRLAVNLTDDTDLITRSEIAEFHDNLNSELLNAQRQNIPYKKLRSDNNDPKWINNYLKNIIGQRKAIGRRINRGEIHLRDYYRVLASRVKTEIRKAKRNNEVRIAREAKTNPKGFYQMYQTKTREKIGPIRSDSGELTDNDGEMSNNLNKYFSTVFTTENLNMIPEAPTLFRDSEENKLSEIVVTSNDVSKQIDKLKPNKSPGPDEIFARVLKECKEELSMPLAKLFNMSLKTGVVPESWRIANVIPIFKKGDRSLSSNYRPISLTSIVGKLLEAIISNSIRNHLEKHRLINDSQHGFTSGRSCLTNLLTFFSSVFESVDEGHNYDVVYLDFSKAFDRVPHERLIRKVEAHGIKGDILKWIRAWLQDRKQRVSINGTKSHWSNVTSGVPQGSVLGPLLFIIYINDIDIGIDSNISKFADDTKIGRVIKSDEDSAKLQEDLNKFFEWSEKWQMKFNVDKCKVLSIGDVNRETRYQMNNDAIEKSDCERDLGVMISRNLKPSKQCVFARNKANKVLGFIQRSVSYKTSEVILKLYLALVRPHLDYAVQFWSPYYRMDIESLERIQRRMTRLIPGIRNLEYRDRLKHLNLHSLERRRARGDLIEVYKWKAGLNKGDITKVLKLSNQERTRNNGFKLDKFRFRREIGKHWFGNRVVDEWNKLPNIIINSNTLNSFKHRLDAYMSNRGWV